MKHHSYILLILNVHHILHSISEVTMFFYYMMTFISN